ncbi:MAG: hypothetical protein EOO61_22635 [Hymenobacter sp.]|nr:MAG: hypothetical protein EOO61_22635 [Hymenobacter sp.]
MLLADYLFYHLSTPMDRATGGSRAGMLVSLLWTLTFFLPTVWLLHHFNSRPWVLQHLNLLTGFIIGLWIPICYLNYRRYSAAHTYARLDSRWGQDSPLEKMVKLLAALSICVVAFGEAFRIFHALE